MVRWLAVFACMLCASAHAGVAITLVPDPNTPVYKPGDVIRIAVFAQLTAGSPATIRLRLMQFDLSDSDAALGISTVAHHLAADIGPIPFWDFSGSTTCANDEASCGTNYFIDGDITADKILNLTYTGLTTSGSFMITLNQTTPKRVGEFNVTMPSLAGTYMLDVLNADNADDNSGAEIRHGFGVTADPGSFTLRAEAGEITGGRITFGPIVPPGPDCNENGTPDQLEDCNANDLPDSCETKCEDSVCGCIGPYEGEYDGASVGTIVSSLDCAGGMNFQFVTSYGPILFQTSATMNQSGVITGQGTKIHLDGEFDFGSCTAAGTWSLFGGAPGDWSMHLTRECLPDCNANTVPDSCEIRDAQVEDCNENAIPDECDLQSGSSFDCNHNNIPDECENPPVFAMTFTDPVDGVVDVRQDRSITGQTAQGFDRVRMRFSCEPYDAQTGQPFNTGSFEVDSTSGITPLVFIIEEAAGENTYDIILTDPIPPGAWTTITAHVESPDGVPIDPGANSVTLGFLPGDVSGNRRSTPSDILDLIDHLNGLRVPPLPTRQCDMDRSGQCTPSDIVRLIDLLNGVNTSRPWLGASLPPNP